MTKSERMWKKAPIRILPTPSVVPISEGEMNIHISQYPRYVNVLKNEWYARVVVDNDNVVLKVIERVKGRSGKTTRRVR